MTTKPMTRSERNILVEHGPYKLRPDGVIEDREGVSLTNCRPNPAAEMIHTGDALTVLRTLPAASVQVCVTSPPYWGVGLPDASQVAGATFGWRFVMRAQRARKREGYGIRD